MEYLGEEVDETLAIRPNRHPAFFGCDARKVCGRRSTTVRPRVRVPCSSISTFARSNLTRPGSTSAATASASCKGAPPASTGILDSYMWIRSGRNAAAVSAAGVPARAQRATSRVVTGAMWVASNGNNSIGAPDLNTTSAASGSQKMLASALAEMLVTPIPPPIIAIRSILETIPGRRRNARARFVSGPTAARVMGVSALVNVSTRKSTACTGSAAIDGSGRSRAWGHPALRSIGGPTRGPSAPRYTGTPEIAALSRTLRVFSVVTSTGQFPATVVTAIRFRA